MNRAWSRRLVVIDDIALDQPLIHVVYLMPQPWREKANVEFDARSRLKLEGKFSTQDRTHAKHKESACVWNLRQIGGPGHWAHRLFIPCDFETARRSK